MEEIEVRIEAEVNPTEDEIKVKRALENAFGNLQFELKPMRRGALLIARTRGKDGLTKLHNLLKRERIRDAARVVMFKGMSGHTVVFYLNKQVGYAGHISFSQPFGESPLGPIKVEIQCQDPVQIIDWLAPRTV